MAQNPHQGPSPHMFGNYNAPPNAFPQMAPHMGIQRPMSTPGNPNIPMMQPTFTSPQYPNMSIPPNPTQHNQPPGRPREWQNPSQHMPFERDSKRPRPFPPNPVDSNFPTNPSPIPSMQPIQSQLQSQMQSQMQSQIQPQQQMSMNPNTMHNPFAPHGQPMPRMQPTGMQPTGNPSLQMNQPQGSFPMNQNQFRSQQPLIPGPQIQDNDPRNPYQFPQKSDAQQPGQPPMQQNAFERNLGLQDREYSRPTDPRASHKHTGNNEDSSEDGEQKQDEVLSFKDFLGKQPDSISPEDAKAAYDRYVMEFTTRKPNRFFDLHKDEEWFKERYFPNYVTARIVRIREEVHDRAKEYREIWDKAGNSACAPDLSSNSEKRGKTDSRKRNEKDDLEKLNTPVGTEIKVEDKTIEKISDGATHKSEDNEEKSQEQLIDTKDEKLEKVSVDVEGSGDTSIKTEETGKIEATVVDTANDADAKSSKEPESIEKKDAEMSDEAEKKLEGSKSEDKLETKVEEKDEHDEIEKPTLMLTDTKDEEKTEEQPSTASPNLEKTSGSSDSEKREETCEKMENQEEEKMLVDTKDETVATQDTKSADAESSNKTEDVKVKSETGEVPQPGNTEEKKSDEKTELSLHEPDVNEKQEEADGEILPDEEECSNKDPSLILPLRRGHQDNTIFLRGIPTNLSREVLTTVLRNGPDGKMDLKFRRLKLGDINPQRRLERFGWAVYASEESATSALETVKGIVVKTKKNSGSNDKKEDSTDETLDDPNSVYEIDCMVNLQRRKKYTQGKVLPSAFSTKSRMEHDVVQAVKIMRFLDNLRQLGKDMNPLTDEFLEGVDSDAKRLDYIVTYLREVHYYCYYSGNEFLEDPTSMPPQELRPSTARETLPSDSDNRILKRVDERAKWVLERDYDRPRSNSDNGEKAKEEAINKWLEANTKNEGHGRFRCGLPPHKLFKGPEFVHKHLRTKHGDKMKSIEEKAVIMTYRANFENDPSKKEVIDIYNEGSIEGDVGKAQRGRHSDDNSGRRGQGFGQGNGDFQRAQLPVGMYNATTPFLGMGVQPFPMMMMSTPGFPGGYAGATGYSNAMNFGGRPMNTSMPSNGMVAMKGNDGRRSHRGRDRDFRDGGYRGGHRGHRSGGKRGGNFGRRGGEKRHRGDDKHLDPRASGPRRSYNDLDAPANGPSFDLVRYDDDV